MKRVIGTVDEYEDEASVRKAALGLYLSTGIVMSALFSHCIRHELYEKMNPISSVRQSSLHQKDPEILTLDEMRRLIPLIKSEAVRVMVAVAATTALRRSEICGLKWKDLNFETKWMNLERGIVHNVETKLKTKASRRGVPMMDDLADLLAAWKTKTPYCGDDDWVFASPTETVRCL